MALASGFIVTNGASLALNGQPIRLAGANCYYLGFAPDATVEPVFALAARMGLNVLRTWAFLDCASASGGTCFHYWNAAASKPAFNDGPDGLERLDRTIALAEQFGMRLILPLVNYWNDFGGINQYLQWFGLSDQNEFYVNPDVRQAYRDYAEHLLLRVNTRTGRQYRDEPAILAWELANEPRCPNGTDTLIAWITDMSSYIKSIDPNHLVGSGDEGFFRRSLAGSNTLYNGSFGVDCERILDIPSIDFGTCHLYPSYSDGGDPVKLGARWIREHIEAGQRANKPMVIEEFGWKVEGDRKVAGDISRDLVFQTWLDQVVQSGGAGALVWMIASNYPDYDHYTIYSEQETPSILSFAGATMRNKAGV